jgi:two-component system cell cycle response regulator DivK
VWIAGPPQLDPLGRNEINGFFDESSRLVRGALLALCCSVATVLVVEDNEANLALAVVVLQSAGHTVLSARDAETGLRLARNERPCLILMDIQLPGMDGLQATVLLKQDDATRSIPVIAVTALTMTGDEARIRAAGFDDYLAKPVSCDDFLTAVATQLAR